MTAKLTHSEKAELLKDSIVYLYSKEGRSMLYISKVLKIDSNVVSKKIKEWRVKKHEGLKPSEKKFVNRNKALIISRLNNDNSLSSIQKELGVSIKFLTRIVSVDRDMSEAFERNKDRRNISKIGESTFDMNYSIESEDGEEWRSILGYPEYEVSSHGRIKSLSGSGGVEERIMVPQPNKNSGRLYVSLRNGKRRNAQVARIVAHSFIANDNPENQTVNHKDGNVHNNHVDNLEWVPQSDNNQHAYDKLRRRPAIAYSKTGRFKKIIVDDRYEFKTIRAFASFIGKGETQASRYIHGEVKDNPYKIDIVY